MKRVGPEAENNTNNLEGARNSPLLGDAGHTRSQEPPSKGLVPDPEECGRDRENEVKKRTNKVLARWPPDPGTSPKTTNQRKLVKRLTGTATGKGVKEKEGTRRKQENFLQGWLEKDKEG